ncbi:hypothetical protein BcepSauron_102 [Burkholderia phage BcepSauron]|uniref:Uncharacterized protein n=1 Tax=Burkholderia phage BcepSauron TaxID=2530033 RepID=A0A482MMK0_9CAUD|nr:hypothetical protein H1O17_gp102 [Burkholderia phage BcepSauron]QBQ74482.1 hypothetical protein BcepSauron_102 [Burkholderia phage BcepSauron]
MGKRFKVRENKAIYINPIEYDGQKLISVRQQYTTAKEPDVWKMGFQGISLPSSAKALRKLAAHLELLAQRSEAGELEFEVIVSEPKSKKEKKSD